MKKLGLALLAMFFWSADLAAQAPYYEGKTIRIVVGYPAGSGHDQWARLIAPQLARHTPGNPNIVVQNMPGAGALIATNYLYGVAKPDGLTLGVNNAALYFEQLLKKPEAKFDWSKFSWIGSTTRTSPLLYMWANAPYETIHDVRNATVPPKCGVTGTGNTGYYLPKLLERAIGTRFQLVAGYKGGADIELAVERGEVQCRAFTIQVFFGREPFHTWRSKILVRVLVFGGKKRDSRIPETPLFSELMDQYKTAELDRRLVTVMLGSGDFGSPPMFAPPNTPAEHVIPKVWLDVLRALRQKPIHTVRDFYRHLAGLGGFLQIGVGAVATVVVGLVHGGHARQQAVGGEFGGEAGPLHDAHLPARGDVAQVGELRAGLLPLVRVESEQGPGLRALARFGGDRRGHLGGLFPDHVVGKAIQQACVEAVAGSGGVHWRHRLSRDCEGLAWADAKTAVVAELGGILDVRLLVPDVTVQGEDLVAGVAPRLHDAEADRPPGEGGEDRRVADEGAPVDRLEAPHGREDDDELPRLALPVGVRWFPEPHDRHSHQVRALRHPRPGSFQA